MKAIFGVLLCYVFFTSQCFAIKGGPVYPGATNVLTTGTYAAVMLPSATESPFENSIGLFSINLPKTGLGTGTLVIFQTGQTYTGTIQGLTDPDSAQLHGLLNATFPYDITIQTSTDDNGNPVFTTQTVVAVASGQLNAQLKANAQQFSTSSVRITGTADVQFSLTVNNVDSEVKYDVFGFQQSTL